MRHGCPKWKLKSRVLCFGKSALLLVCHWYHLKLAIFSKCFNCFLITNRGPNIFKARMYSSLYPQRLAQCSYSILINIWKAFFESIIYSQEKSVNEICSLLDGGNMRSVKGMWWCRRECFIFISWVLPTWFYFQQEIEWQSWWMKEPSRHSWSSKFPSLGL